MHHIPGIRHPNIFNLSPTEAPGGILHRGKSLRKNILKDLTGFEALAEFISLSLQLLISQLLVLHFQDVDAVNYRLCLFQETPVVTARKSLKHLRNHWKKEEVEESEQGWQPKQAPLGAIRQRKSGPLKTG
jgi:hypothetical protein